MSKDAVVKTARREIGYMESPKGSNRTKYGESFGWNGVPWCVIFLWWCFRETDESMAFFGNGKTASCETMLRWYKEQGQTVPVDEVQPGDIVILNFKGTTDTQHCGLVEEVTHGPILSINTIEGNTAAGSGSQDNGGMVAAKIRYRSQIVAVCRPKYKEEPMLPETDYETHWAAKDIDLAIERGLMKGYPDGTFKPDKPVTRAELAVIIRRIIEYVKGG